MNNKIFNLTSKEDYIYYLSEIIADFITYKNRLSIYQLEMNDLIAKNKDKKMIEIYLYQSISDRIKSLFYYIFNLIGDETKLAISYRKFRKRLYKNKVHLNLSIEDLSEDEKQIINNFNKHRNWGLHIPESLIVQKKKFLKIDDDFINKYKNNIAVIHYEFFEIEYLEKLNEETIGILSELKILENRIFKDYRLLVNEPFEINIETQQVKPYQIMDVVKASFNGN